MSSASSRRSASSSSDEGGGANWMDTYGDLVTLLLTFFVLLFSFSTIDAIKWQTLVGAFSGVSAVTIPDLTTDLVYERPIPTIQKTAETESEQENDRESSLSMMLEGKGQTDDEQAIIDYENFMTLYRNMDVYIRENDVHAELHADFETYTITVRFVENVLFDSGSSTLLASSTPSLNHLIHLLSENIALISMINIEGHTDNRSISTARYRDNWDLSVARATNVLRYVLEAEQIDSKKISAVGYGEYHPVDTNDTDAGRAANRRVDFVVQSLKGK